MPKKYRQNDVEATLYLIDNLIAITPEFASFVAPIEFREMIRIGGTDEQRDRFVNKGIEMITDLVVRYDRSAREGGYDLDKVVKETLGVKKGFVELAKQLPDNPALLKEVADEYYRFYVALKHVGEKGKGAVDDRDKALVYEEARKIAQSAAAPKTVDDRDGLIARIAVATFGKSIPFEIKHYEEGQSSSPDFQKSHDRIVLTALHANQKEAKEAIGEIVEGMQSFLGRDEVKLRYGTSKGRWVVNISGKDGELTIDELKKLADTVEKIGEMRRRASGDDGPRSGGRGR